MPEYPDEELVRRLLAASREDEPMPADVVARLDGVLDDLAAERRTGDTVVPLRRASRVRRRWATGLVAAAAIVVGGVTLHSMTGGEGADFSTSREAASDSAGGARADSGSIPPGPSALQAGEVADLHRATLRADVRRAVARLGTASDPLASLGPFGCRPDGAGPGTAVPARLDGADAALVLRPPADGRQVADVLECGTGRVLASVTVPAR